MTTMTNHLDLYRRQEGLTTVPLDATAFFDAMSLRDQRHTARQFSELVRAYTVTSANGQLLGVLFSETEEVVLETLQRVWWGYRMTFQQMPGIDQEWLFEQFYTSADGFRQSIMRILERHREQALGIVSWQPVYEESTLKSVVKDFFFWFLRQLA